MRHSCQTTIETRSHAILRQVAEAVIATARLAIVRGPAGIGKSFALQMIQAELSDENTQIYVVTANSDNGGSIRKFFADALLQLELMTGGGTEMQRFGGYMLRSYPFRNGGPKSLLVIDECQHLGAKVLEALRFIYDRGDMGRKFDRFAPAFGMLLVGNDRFLTRGGRSERAAFEALMTRTPIEWEIDRPSAEETLALARTMFPEDAVCLDRMAAFGDQCGSLREMAETLAIAEHFAGEGPVTILELEQAINLSMGGR